MARGKRTVTVPADETKEQRFVRLAMVRMTAARKALRLIGQLSGSGYASTEQQRDSMRKTLLSDLDNAFGRFTKSADDAADTFQFGG